MRQKNYTFTIYNENINKTVKEVEERISKGTSGVYRFSIQLKSLERFEKEWGDYKSYMAKRRITGKEIKDIVKGLEDHKEYSIARVFNIRNVPALNKSNKKRLLQLNKLNDATLYLGSAECLYSRIKEHCIDRNSGQTYSLKLDKFLERYSDFTLKLHIVLCNKERMRELENSYHDKYLPLVGKR